VTNLSEIHSVVLDVKYAGEWINGHDLLLCIDFMNFVQKSCKHEFTSYSKIYLLTIYNI